MAAYLNSKKLVPLAAVLCLLVAAAFGGYLAAGNRGPETVNLAGASGASGQDVTVYACLAAGQLTSVSTAVPKCPANAVPVQWVAQRVPSSPGPSSPAPSSSSPPAASSGPPAGAAAGSSGSGARCVTSALAGTCGPYADPDITDADGYNTNIANNMWGCGAVQPPAAGAYCGLQTVAAHGPGNWSVTSKQKAGNTGVLSYPDVAQVFTLGNDTDPPITGFSAITSSFTETMNATAKTDAEAAYDIWLDNGKASDEIMIWVDNHGQTPAGKDKGPVVIGGTRYELWSADGTTSFVRSNERSGTVNILAVLRWLQSHRYVSSTARLGQVDFGWEICSTGGVPETFTISHYTLKDTCGSGCSA